MRLEDEIFQKQFRNEYHKLAVNLLYTNSILSSFISNFLKKYGISMQQYNILRILRGQYPQFASVSLLKERMLDKMSDASRLVDRLKIKGLLIRKTNKSDRRGVEITITQKGLWLLKQIDKKNNSIDKLLDNLSVKEAKMLNDLLDKMRK